MFEAIAYYLLKITAKIVQALPISASLFFARILGLLVYGIDKRRFIAYANIKAAFGNQYSASEIRAIVRKSYIHFAQMFFEILYFPKMDKAYIDRYIEQVNVELYERIGKPKQGMIALTAHFGNWELLQVFSSIIGCSLHVLAREQKMARLDQFLNELRSVHGAKPIHTKGMKLRELIRVLKEGKIVGVLGDQGGGRNGTHVEFFGRETTSPTGIMAIAAKTGAAVVPLFCFRKDGPYHLIQITEQIELVKTGNEKQDERENNRRYLERLEEFIRRKPEGWLWMYKRWKFCFTKRVVVLEDKRAGHASQAKAIAREFDAVAPEFGINDLKMEFIPVRFKNSLSPVLFFIFSLFFIRFAQSRLKWLRFFFDTETTQALEKIPYADFIISCGSGLVPLNLWLSREYLAKTTVVMKPPFPYTFFKYDLVIFPKHDSARGFRSPNVRTLFSPNLATKELLEETKQKFSEQVKLNGRTKVSVFIGGRSKAYSFDPSKFKVFLGVLREEAEKLNLDLMLTTSRRTEAVFEKMVKDMFTDYPHSKLLVIANEKNLDGVTYGMLGLSDIALVTEDSVSMISEAVSAGKHVIVAEVGNQALSHKHRRFKEILAEEKLIRLASPAGLSNALREIGYTRPKHELIAEEREKIRQAIRSLM